MEMTKCPYCGIDVAADADYCEGCGSRLTPPTYAQSEQAAYVQPPYQAPYQPPYQAPYTAQPPYQSPYQPPYQPVYVVEKPKIPGRGLGIASMVLGIIGVVYSFSLMIETFTLSDMRFFEEEFFATLLGPILVFAVFPILALSFGGVARQRGYRNGVSTAGVALGAVAAVLIFLALIGVLVNL
ncbi:MAG: zinc ribbon domain-containing protein [Clostridia bacterium]|nr:zinc ribbon domain-containing protein [Clostridia bacterium]